MGLPDCDGSPGSTKRRLVYPSTQAEAGGQHDGAAEWQGHFMSLFHVGSISVADFSTQKIDRILHPGLVA